MKRFAWMAFAGLLAALPAAAADKMGAQDQSMLKKLAQGDMAEVAGGKMAQDKASSDEVKKFAAKMAEDHGRMLEEKKQMAQSKGVTLPSSPDKKQQAEAKKLQALASKDFDRKYMQHMVKDHTEDLKAVQKAARGAKDPDLKAAAQKAEPMIREHLDMAKQIASSLGSGSSGASKAK